MTPPLLTPGPHGGDGARLAVALGIPPDDVLDLSLSLNPVAPDVAPIVARHLGSLRAYPDASRATIALAERLGIDETRLVLTNGGAEAIALVAGVLGRGWVDDPDFSLYRRHLDCVDPDGPVFRSNPHSPSGLLAETDRKADVWDEAFYPLATGSWTRHDFEHGCWVVGSLTKLFACPGLRIGYVAAPDEPAADAVRRRQPEWSVGALGCAALPELLDTADLEVWQRSISTLRTSLTELLVTHGYEPRRSDANWVLVEAPGLRDELARRAIAVRDCASFGLGGVVRIAVPHDAGLVRLESALRSIDPSTSDR